MAGSRGSEGGREEVRMEGERCSEWRCGRVAAWTVEGRSAALLSLVSNLEEALRPQTKSCVEESK